MVTIKIDKTYKGCENWSEMSCQTASELYAVPLPEKLRQYYQDVIDGKDEQEILLSITKEELIKEFPTYYGKIISILFDVPDNVMSKVKYADRTWFFDMYCRSFILGLHWLPNLEHTDIKEIECEGELLLIPQPKDVLGAKVPAADETAQSFAEAADLMLVAERFAGGKFELAPHLVSIFCRPKGEIYNENISLERAKKLQNIKMDVVWEVFFCLTEFLPLQNTRDLLSLLNQATSKKKWHQRLRDYLHSAGMVQYLKFLRNTKALNMSKL